MYALFSQIAPIYTVTVTLANVSGASGVYPKATAVFYIVGYNAYISNAAAAAEAKLATTKSPVRNR